MRPQYPCFWAWASSLCVSWCRFAQVPPGFWFLAVRPIGVFSPYFPLCCRSASRIRYGLAVCRCFASLFFAGAKQRDAAWLMVGSFPSWRKTLLTFLLYVGLLLLCGLVSTANPLKNALRQR
jgi:hypothetical protein